MVQGILKQMKKNSFVQKDHLCSTIQNIQQQKQHFIKDKQDLKL
jgi:hypothetical protein